MSSNMNDEIIEILANLEHKRWSKWQSYMHKNCIKNTDGSLTIPKDKVERWERQIETDYVNLPENEKQSDRNQAYNTIETIKTYIRKDNKFIIVAGFGGIGKTYLGKKYLNVVDMESGFYRYINDNCLDIPVEKRKGTTIREFNPNWPQNYYNAILQAKSMFDIVLTSMHWHLLEFYERNKIPYYLAFPKQGLEDEYRKRCYDRGNNETFTEHMVDNIKIWGEKIKQYHPIKLLYLDKNEYLEDVLKRENLLN